MLNYFFNPITVAKRIARRATKKFDTMVNKLCKANDKLYSHINNMNNIINAAHDNIGEANMHLDANNKTISQLSGLVRC